MSWIKITADTNLIDLKRHHSPITERLEEGPGTSSFPWYQIEDVRLMAGKCILNAYNTHKIIYNPDGRQEKNIRDLMSGDWHYRIRSVDELIAEEEELQRFLLPGYYTMIASAELLGNENFHHAVNNCAPGRNPFAMRKSKDYLGHKECVRRIIRTLPPDTHLEIMLLFENGDPLLLYSTWPEYIDRNNVDQLG